RFHLLYVAFEEARPKFVTGVGDPVLRNVERKLVALEKADHPAEPGRVDGPAEIGKRIGRPPEDDADRRALVLHELRVRGLRPPADVNFRVVIYPEKIDRALPARFPHLLRLRDDAAHAEVLLPSRDRVGPRA